MGKIRHLYPGGNTCYGFYSFYDHIAGPGVKRKIILKGGPGVGKSAFMKKSGDDFAWRGCNVEYHWCSSDNDSLDAVVLGNGDYCILDGTRPHIVEPVFPGAVDEILNLGQFWNRKIIQRSRDSIIHLTQEISWYFNRAYKRLEESNLAYEELKQYGRECLNEKEVKRNTLAFGADFFPGTVSSYKAPRHLFAAAITPGGPVCKLNSLVNADTSVFAVKGLPGSGVDRIFAHVLHILNLSGVYTEIYHNPLNPADIDAIIVPSNNSILINISSDIIPYEKVFTAYQFKRFLDFSQFVDQKRLDYRANLLFAAARMRFEKSLQDAVELINKAKKHHDELEALYNPAMDFAALDRCREKLCQELSAELN